jgi:hydroxymethylbilane synthase
MKTLIFATRPSALARWQTQWVIYALEQAWPGLQCREEVITTEGDRVLNRPLPEIGGKGLFTQELEEELLSGRVHVAVHSLKDLPVENSPRLVLGAVPARSSVEDVLVSKDGFALDTLPPGALVGTSSLRRSAQVLAYRPDVEIMPLRGNVDTRIRKAESGQYDAIVLAAAGVLRLGLEDHISQRIPLEIVLPAPGQGALAVQCAAEDKETLELLAAIHDPATQLATAAERAFLTKLGGGCSLPVAAHATISESSEGNLISLSGLVADPDGSRVIRCQQEGHDPDELGALCAKVVISHGAEALLNAIPKKESTI